MNSSAQHKLLVEMKSLVESNLQNQQFSVEELAERMGMSRSHLHRKLKEATGQSVSQFIREYRLQKALELLRHGEQTASEIAYQVGFSSATYFSKSFHDYYGYTPGEAKQKGIEAALRLRDVPEPVRKKKGRINLSSRIGIALFAVGCFATLALISCSQETCQYSDDYIPKNITDAVAYLDCVIDEETKTSIITPDEQRTVAMLHVSLGLQLRNKWGLWKANNRLVEYFNSLGITHPDDMSGIILTSYYRQLNDKEINLDQQIEHYKNYWLKMDKNNEMTPEEQEHWDSIMNITDEMF